VGAGYSIGRIEASVFNVEGRSQRAPGCALLTHFKVRKLDSLCQVRIYIREQIVYFDYFLNWPHFR
jgi:hypothetical protein